MEPMPKHTLVHLAKAALAQLPPPKKGRRTLLPQQYPPGVGAVGPRGGDEHMQRAAGGQDQVELYGYIHTYWASFIEARWREVRY